MQKVRASEKFYYLFPQSVAIIGVGRNLMPVAWHTPISSKPPLYGALISPKRHTYELLLQENGFTVNFLTHDHANTIAKLGSTSGREIDKIRDLKIPVHRAPQVNGMIMSDSYGAYECQKFALNEYGDHFLLVGRIISVHVAEEVMQEKEIIDERRVRPALYFGKDRYLTIDPATLSIHKK
ncbi:MAG: flavin reductase family protein [candidate division WOR-3 bacterium]|nr:MAG: flavin reductase family protein [candidate division WOR-3 bacterium]